MKFDFETQEFINILQEMLQDYGRMVLSEGRKCYSLWLDYAPQLPEEGELLKVFLEQGLGKQVVELKNSSVEERAAWRNLAIKNLVSTGETEKDATSLVDAILEALGWSAKKAPVASKASAKTVTKNTVAKNPEKPQVTTKGKSGPQQEIKDKPKKSTKQVKDNAQKSVKKADPILDMVKQELQNRWLRIVEEYMPKAFPKVHQVDFENLSMPKYITNVLNKYLGADGVQQYKYLAYGKNEFKGIWVVLTDSALMVHSILGEKNFIVTPYQNIQQMTLTGNSVFLKSVEGWKQEISLDLESYYFTAMIRLMQGKVGEEVITNNEWKGFFSYWGSRDNCKYYVGLNEMPPKKQRNVKEWMNSIDTGYKASDIIVVVDATFFGSCKDATVITKDAIYHKWAALQWRNEIADIDNMIVSGPTQMQLSLKDGQKVILHHIVNISIFAQLVDAFVFIKQHSH